MTTPLRIAVVGSGIGAQHVQGYQAAPELFQVAAVCDIDPQRGSALAQKYGIRESLTDFSALLNRPDVDVVDLCTPPYLHFQQILDALDSGKDVICEKPITGSLAELDRLEEVTARTGTLFMPIFQYRFGHGLQKLKLLVDRQLTGDAFVFNVDIAWWRSSDYYAAPWRGKRATELGGALLSQASHALDMIFYVLGTPRTLLARTATRVNPIDVEDCVAIAMEMSDGSLGTISVTLGSAAQISRHRFTFRNVSAESNTKPYSNSTEPWVFSFPEERPNEQILKALNEFTPQAEGYEGQFRRFHEALTRSEPLPVTLQDARRVLESVAAVYWSAESGERVSLPLTRSNPKYTHL
jgi:predicted dehydrogenase